MAILKEKEEAWKGPEAFWIPVVWRGVDNPRDVQIMENFASVEGPELFVWY